MNGWITIVQNLKPKISRLTTNKKKSVRNLDFMVHTGKSTLK